MSTPTIEDGRAAEPTSGSSRRTGRRTGQHAAPGRPIGSRLAAFSDAVRQRWADWTELAAPLLGPTRAALACVTGLGWLVAGGAVVAWGLALALGWREFGYAAAVLAALFGLSCLLTLGRTNLEVEVRVQPQRVVEDDSAAVEVRVCNAGKAPLLALPLDLPTGGDSITRFSLPGLSPGAEFDDVVPIPGRRRGVYQIGPARTQRGDPFGIVRREVVWTEPVELFVHPRTVHLDELGSGMLKDLEGRSTNDMSMSDLAFHTLREYAPGDDRRHIHWLSSAKRSGADGSEQFMVRQFLDTRRSHLGVVIDCAEQSWLDPAEFETAVSGAASVAARALRDGQDVSEACGPFVLGKPRRHTALDLFARARLGEERLESVVADLTRTSPNISAALLFVGPLTPMATIRRSAVLFSPDVNVVTVRVEHGSAIGLQRAAGRSILTIGSLADLPRALAGKVSG